MNETRVDGVARRSPGIARWLRHRFVVLTAGALLVSVVSVVGPLASNAEAAVATVTCAGTSQIVYTPGLTLNTRFVSYKERDDYSACISSDSKLNSGFSVAHSGGPASCVFLPIVLRDPGYTIKWNSGKVSTMNIVFTDTIVGGTENVNAVGSVVKGEFKGATVVIVWAYPVINILQCLNAPGVVDQVGPIVLQITSV